MAVTMYRIEITKQSASTDLFVVFLKLLSLHKHRNSKTNVNASSVLLPLRSKQPRHSARQQSLTALTQPAYVAKQAAVKSSSQSSVEF